MTTRRRRLRGPSGPTGPVVLGLECGGEHVGVALMRLPDEPGRPAVAWRLLEETVAHRGHRHADTLLTLAHAMLERHGLSPKDLALVAAGRGPGGFTGVRVGLATALGLGLGLGIPAWPVGSLDALARHAAGRSEVAVPLIDARRGEVYGAAFRVPLDGPPEEVLAPRVAPADAVLAAVREATGDAATLVFGSGALAYDRAGPVPASWHVPSASAVAWLAASRWDASGRTATPPAIDPAYVRKSDAEIALEARAEG